jgi:hypothetical protein
VTRALSADVTAMLGDGSIHAANMVEVTTTAGTTYLTDAHTPIDYGGNTYLAAGYLLGFSDVVEFADVQIASMTLSLSGVDQTMMSALLNNDYIDQYVTVMKAFLHHTDASLVGTPVTLFVGRIDSAGLREDPDAGTSTLTVTATSHWVDFERRSGRHTNAAEHSRFFPGDTGMDYADEDEEVYWGPGTWG